MRADDGVREDRYHRRRLAEAEIAIDAIDMSERRVLSALDRR